MRSLDQEGPGKDGENLAELWKALSHNASGQFYAAEQSSLRWLLKMMNPSTKASPESETLRRYPLTWNILNCVFQCIPLFSLAKSLADRRFIAVLKQTVKDLSSPSGEDGHVSSPDRKRKRSTQIAFDVDALRKPTGCLKSANALFEALRSLLSRLGSAAELSRREVMGAEHVRTLFASPAAESLELVGPMLAICYNSLEVLNGAFEVNVSWVKVASDIWDLRIRGGGDALEVATRATQTTLTMFANLDEEVRRISGREELYSDLPSHIRLEWAADLQDFLQRNLFLPARTAYINSEGLDPLNMAMLMAQRNATVTGPAVYLLAQNSPKPFDEKSKEKVSDWINEVVKAIDRSLRNLPPYSRPRIIEGILGEARVKGTNISEDVLRDICSKYAFETENNVRWSTLSASLRLDPDILFDQERDNDLLNSILGNIPDLDKLEGDEAQHVMHVMDAIIKAHLNAKDFTSFLKLWYEQLSKADLGTREGLSPWLETSVRRSEAVFTQSKLEIALTVNQLRGVLDWLESRAVAKPECLYIILDSISHGLGSPEFIDAVGMKIADLVLTAFPSSCTSNSLLSLRWSVLSQIITWLNPQERDDLWTKIKEKAAEVLELGRLADPDTLEAFKFIFTVWSLMTPDGDYKEDVSSIAKAAVNRLTKEIPAKAGKRTVLDWKQQQRDKPLLSDASEAKPEAYLVWYLAYTLGDSSRFLP